MGIGMGGHQASHGDSPGLPSSASKFASRREPEPGTAAAGDGAATRKRDPCRVLLPNESVCSEPASCGFRGVRVLSCPVERVVGHFLPARLAHGEMRAVGELLVLREGVGLLLEALGRLPVDGGGNDVV